MLLALSSLCKRWRDATRKNMTQLDVSVEVGVGPEEPAC